MGKYVYIRTEPRVWTVGFYTPSGEWVPESDWPTPQEAAKRVKILNGNGDHFHICDLCHRKCPVGKAVSEGIYDEYIREKIAEDFGEDVGNINFLVIVTECPRN